VFFDLSPNGTVLYDPSQPSWEFIRVSRDGAVSPVDPQWSGPLVGMSLSPDGSRLAVDVVNAAREEIWVKTLPAGPFTRIAYEGSRNARPKWLPDGRSVSFVSDAEGSYGLFRAPADGSSPPRRSFNFSRPIDEAEWSRDGRWLVLRAGSGSGRHLYSVQLGVDTVPRPIAQSAFEEFAPSLSPDSKWLAYTATVSGHDEVYVQSFPGTGGERHQVSSAGGNEPLWSHSGRELYYRNLRGELVVVTIETAPAFRVTSQRVLFQAVAYLADNRSRNYAVSPDDKTFYFMRAKSATAVPFVVILNWLEELKAKVGK